MKIKFWGVRGTVSVCGKKFLKYGGNTTCISLTDKNGDMIIVDCGTGIRELGKQIYKKIRKINIVLTHQHWDHVLGFPFFHPIYDSKAEIFITGCSYKIDDVKAVVSKIMQPPGFPVKFDEIDAKFNFIKMEKDGININNFSVFPIEISHPNGGFGYRFIEGAKSVVFLTDNELGYIHPGGRSFNDYVEFSKKCDVLICDADYTDEEYKKRKTWGHSTATQAVELAIKSSSSMLVLFHHNQDRTDDEIDKIVDDCRKRIKKEGLKIQCIAAYEGLELVL